MRKIAILGLGLMGASLAMAARKKRLARAVVGYSRRPSTRQKAVRMQVCDEVLDSPVDAVAGVDLVVMCVPILAIPSVAIACRDGLSSGAVVTDVGSTKAQLALAMPRALRKTGAVFVGSHPMAGSDAAGIEAARPDLYTSSTVVVTPASKTPAPALRRVESLWTGVGANILLMGPQEHDAIVARTSHLPHMIASLLVRCVFRHDIASVRQLCGPGFRDTTRIAGGSEDVWDDIVRTNPDFLRKELAVFEDALVKLQTLLKRRDFSGVRRLLADSRRQRRSLARTAP